MTRGPIASKLRGILLHPGCNAIYLVLVKRPLINPGVGGFAVDKGHGGDRRVKKAGSYFLASKTNHSRVVRDAIPVVTSGSAFSVLIAVSAARLRGEKDTTIAPLGESRS